MACIHCRICSPTCWCYTRTGMAIVMPMRTILTQYANTAQNNYPAPAPAPARVAQSSSHHQPVRNYQTQPAQAKNSPVGIGVGAVIGGLVGSQIGNGNGRTLATIAGAVGGGYVGNEVAKRNP